MSRFSRIVPLKRKLSCVTTPTISRKRRRPKSRIGRAVHQDFSAVVFVKAGQQIDQGRLSRAGRADEGNGFAWARMEADVLQRGQLPFRVAEAHIVEAHIADDLHVGLRFPLAPAGLDWFIDNLENALARGAPGLHQLIQLMQFPDRLVEKTGQDEESGQIAELHRAAQHRACADPDHAMTPSAPIRYIEG